jgi:prepilin-type N-terminal cleavage/methylation domain-containing protein
MTMAGPLGPPSSSKGTSVRRGSVRSRWGSDDGMTLIEVMVAMLVLGIVLSGLATVMMSSMRAIVKNEREVRATSLAQQAIEELQAIEWFATGLYEGEATVAGPTWSDLLGELEGEPAYLTQYGHVDDRLPQVPAPVRQYEQANVEYTVRTYVNWVDTDANNLAETKRFTAIVTWLDAAGHEREIRSSATRIPTQSEAPATSAGVRVLAFSVSPDPAQLSFTSGGNLEPLRITVRTNQQIEANAPRPEIRYYTLDADDVPTLRTRQLDGTGGGSIWSTTIPANHHRWANGFVDILFVGEDLQKNLIEAWGSVEFSGGPMNGPSPKPPSSGDSGGSFPYPTPAKPPPAPDPDENIPDEPVSIGSVLHPLTICVQNSNWALKSPFEVTIHVTGMREIDNVIVGFDSYTAKNGTINRTTQAAMSVSGSSTTFKMVIPAGQRFFSPGSKVAFEAVASRSDGSNDLRESSPAVVSSSC